MRQSGDIAIAKGRAEFITRHAIRWVYIYDNFPIGQFFEEDGVKVVLDPWK